MLNSVHSLHPENILEMGVGTGLTLGRYPLSANVVGVDICEDMLQRARKRVAHLPNRNIRLLTMDAETLNFPDDSFDCVTLPYVLSVTPDPTRLIAETRRVCRRNGHIIILNHFSGSKFWWLLEKAVSSMADKVGFRSDFLFSEHILAHNWQVESVKSVNLFGLSKLVLIRNV